MKHRKPKIVSLERDYLKYDAAWQQAGVSENDAARAVEQMTDAEIRICAAPVDVLDDLLAQARVFLHDRENDSDGDLPLDQARMGEMLALGIVKLLPTTRRPTKACGKSKAPAVGRRDDRGLDTWTHRRRSGNPRGPGQSRSPAGSGAA